MINNQEELRQTANQLAARGKGLLAVDESTPTIGKRLAGINVVNTEENRQAYRGMLFTAEGIGEFISGVILFEETLYQNHLDGETMVSKINKLGIIPGIKVDKGLSPLNKGLVLLNGVLFCKLLLMDVQQILQLEKMLGALQDMQKFARSQDLCLLLNLKF